MATLVALVWANWPGDSSYSAFWDTAVRLPGPGGFSLSLRSWVNDGAMVAFFALVGIEIRREMTVGELTSLRRSATPILAAVGGMVIPAVIYLAVLQGGPGSQAWGIPMATDVAFALGALALVARRASPRVRVFLMTLAVADDIGSVLILVCFYSQKIEVVPLLEGMVCLAVMALVRVVWSVDGWVVLVLGAAAWGAFVHAGIEPAVVGVAIGLCLPATINRKRGLSKANFERGPRHLEDGLSPWVNLLVLPLFALGNAGLRLVGSGLATAPAMKLLAAVLIARVVGKLVGVSATTRAVTRFGGDLYDHRIAPKQLSGMSALASVGFTVPLLVIRAALPDGPLAAGATAGLLLATIAGIGIGAILFATARRTKRSHDHAPTN